MANQKLDNLLNLSLDLTPEERQKSDVLNIGYEGDNIWELIVRYTGNLSELLSDYEDITVVNLFSGFAILTIPQRYIESLSALPQITFIEQPKRLFFNINQARSASCINPLFYSPWNLSGKEILIGIVDSGITLTHPDFLNEDGTTRVLFLWDQTADGTPPAGYATGAEWSKEEIDSALQNRETITTDLSGHGTAVAGIAAGNGRASQNRYRGIAFDASLVIVKLGTPLLNSFPRTTQLMQGVNYCIQKSLDLQMPLVLNLSFGNNYGSHDGTALLESYLNQVANIGKTTICIGSGNEASAALHASGILTNGKEENIMLSVGPYEPNLNIQIWKSYVDQFDISLRSPSGTIVGPFQQILGTQRFRIGQTSLFLYYGEPNPYSQAQEIYLEFLPINDYIDSGIWYINLIPRNIVTTTTNYHLWLPGGGVLNGSTRFLQPTPDTTLTTPSTASVPITVGAYNSLLGTYADFSGRGYTRTNQIKPDLVAPGVNITAPVAPDGYGSFSGTSFATPIVSGSAALMMEWGIINGNDPFLYGEKLKAYLLRGALPLAGETVYPSPRLGYGKLCLENSFPNQ